MVSDFMKYSTIDMDHIMENVRKRIHEKKASGQLKDIDIADIQDMELQPLPDYLDIPNLYQNHLFPEDYEKKHPPLDIDIQIQETGIAKTILKHIRAFFFPIIRFMIRPIYIELKASIIDLMKLTPTIIQSKEYIKLLHNTINNTIVEITKLKIEEEMIKTRLRIVEDKIEFVENRERMIEKKIFPS